MKKIIMSLAVIVLISLVASFRNEPDIRYFYYSWSAFAKPGTLTGNTMFGNSGLTTNGGFPTREVVQAFAEATTKHEYGEVYDRFNVLAIVEFKNKADFDTYFSQRIEPAFILSP